MKNRGSGPMFWLVVIIFLSACGPAGRQPGQETPQPPEDGSPLPQNRAALLDGTHKAICYSGFRSGQHPDRGEGAKNPSREQVLEDLLILSEEAGYPLIRLYDCGENSEMVLNIIRENDLDIRVLLGIWLRAELSNHETCEWLTEPIPEEELQENKERNAAEISKGIALANAFPEIIVAVNVGNEALVDWNDHKVPVDTVIAYVQKVKQGISQEVTVADNYKWWADSGAELAKEVDFVSIHIYPVWEGKDIGEALSYSLENIRLVQDSLPGARIVITEAGWPSVASEFGERASEDKQQQYVEQLLNWSEENHFTTFIFEAFDEDWKGDPNNPMGAEKHWGLFNIDRTPKKVMKHIYSRNN